MRENLAAVADLDIVIDESVRSYLDIVAQFCGRAHRCKRRNLIHILFISLRLPGRLSLPPY